MNNGIATLQQHKTKAQARELITQVLSVVRDESAARNLRLLAFPASEWGYEKQLLASPIGRRISGIVGLEAKPEEYDRGVTTKKALHREYPNTRLQLINTTDYRLCEPDGNGGQTCTQLRGRADLGKGFDMIWLDWMQHWGPGISASLSAMVNNMTVFERAWRTNLPGLLWLTMCVGEERRSFIARLAAAYYHYTGIRISAATKDTDQLYQLRFKGVASWLNLKAHAEGLVCVPTHSIIYQEAPDNPTQRKQTMMLQGYHVWPEAKWPTDITEEIKNIVPQRGFQ